jgi:hypothetical protein
MRLLEVIGAALLITISLAVAASVGQAASSGPMVSIGLTSEDEGDLVHTAVGWRWEYDAGERADSITEGFGVRLNWVVEPHAAILSDDRDGVEFQILPMVQVTPRTWADSAVVPYLEAGVGLIYIDVTGFDMGSQILFSDNIGVRLDFGRNAESNKWSLGYRFRHISHAGIWASSNSGMNTHWFTLSYQLNGG